MKIIEETYKWARTNFKNQNPDTIAIHHAAAKSCTAQDIHRWHLDRGWMGIAYHYFIRKDGTIYRGRQETWQGGGLYGSENADAIQICLEGCYTDYGNQTEKNVPSTQLEALFCLVNDIRSRHTIKAIKKHADYPSAQGKDCPGKYFPWQQFIDSVTDPVPRYKAEIQKHCKFSYPEGVWEYMDKHPYARDLYKKWAESYK